MNEDVKREWSCSNNVINSSKDSPKRQLRTCVSTCFPERKMSRSPCSRDKKVLRFTFPWSLSRLFVITSLSQSENRVISRHASSCTLLGILQSLSNARCNSSTRGRPILLLEITLVSSLSLFLPFWVLCKNIEFFSTIDLTLPLLFIDSLPLKGESVNILKCAAESLQKTGQEVYSGGKSRRYSNCYKSYALTSLWC